MQSKQMTFLQIDGALFQNALQCTPPQHKILL